MSKRPEREYNHQYYLRNRDRLRKTVEDRIGITAKKNVQSSYNKYAGRQDLADTITKWNENDQDLIDRIDSLNLDPDDTLRDQHQEAVENIEQRNAMDQLLGISKRAEEAHEVYQSALTEYANTPLGKVENAVEQGRQAVSNALKAVSDLTVSALSKLKR